MNKIISYIGFAIKSNNVIVGQTALKKSKKQIYLVMCCKTASQNLIDLGKNVSQKNNCDIIVTNVELACLTHLKDVKIIGITDENLSRSILENKEKISIG